MTDRPSRPPLWPELDGVRAFAVLSVMMYHFYRPHFFTAGYLGVDVFFVLSGFLITHGLVRDWTSQNPSIYGRFYARRALRLFPALAAVTVFGVVLAATVLPQPLRSQTFGGVPWIVLYVGNWARATGASSLGILGHLWSLAVEEQFYLLWPIVLLSLLRWKARPRHIGTAVAGVAVAEAVYREVLFRHGFSVMRLANGLDTHSDALLAGCAVALWLSDDRLQQIPAVRLRAATWVGWATIVALELTGNGSSSFQWAYPLTALAGGVIVASLVTSPAPALRAVLGSRAAVWTGRRSYGLYLWSYPLYYGIQWPRGFTGWPRDLVEFALSFVVAAASYRWIEQPFLRRKRRFQAQPSTELRAPA